jgi:hypothetical protein
MTWQFFDAYTFVLALLGGWTLVLWLLDRGWRVGRTAWQRHQLHVTIAHELAAIRLQERVAIEARRDRALRMISGSVRR